MYGGAALVSGSLAYWHGEGELRDRTLEGLATTLALSVSGVTLLLLAHAGAVATRRKALLFVSKMHDTWGRAAGNHRRWSVLQFALGSWATALGMLGTTGWLVWRSMRFDVCGNLSVKPYLCAFLFMQTIVDKKNQLLFVSVYRLIPLYLMANYSWYVTRSNTEFSTKNSWPVSRHPLFFGKVECTKGFIISI